MDRQTILKRLQKKIDEGKAVVGTGAGTGLSAKCEEAGGSDLIIVYNSGWFRMQGLCCRVSRIRRCSRACLRTTRSAT